MSIILSEKKHGDFRPADEGNWKAVCVDVTPPELRASQYGEHLEFRFVFELVDAPEVEIEIDGLPSTRRQCVWSRGYRLSLNEKSNLRKFLRQWLGRDLSVAELKELDAESFLGKSASLVIQHETREDKVFANIVACLPYRGDTPLAASGSFVRKQDREQKAQGSGGQYKKAQQPSSAPVTAKAVDDTQAGADWTTVKVHVGNNKGIALRDLDQDAVKKLIEKWLPLAQSSPKPTADDKRLIAALKEASAFFAKHAAIETSTVEVDY